jgi:adenylosuccinate synthase
MGIYYVKTELTTSLNFSSKGNATAVVGAQWGDEGKGKIVDALAGNFNAVVRFQGGANAGHTINNKYGRFALHLLPSGVFEKDVVNVLGCGTAIHVPTLFKELDEFEEQAKLKPHLVISDRAQVVLDAHILLDQYREDGKVGRTFGSTKSGIAPFYSSKYAKRGIRIGEILFNDKLQNDVEAALEEVNILAQHAFNKPLFDVALETEKLFSYRERLAPYVSDTTTLLHNILNNDGSILVEGQLGALRDPDHGIYPYSTSSSTLAGYATIGAGIPPYKLSRIIAVAKAYSSKVGTGPFVAEIKDQKTANDLRALGGDKGEYGATTGRPRDVGWFDAVATRYGVKVQGATEIALTNLDVLGHFNTVPICVEYVINDPANSKAAKHVKDFPLNCELAYATPILEEMPGWNVSKEVLSQITSYSKLPDNARRYVEKIEQLCQCPVKLISIGPRRDQLLER